MIEKNDLKGKYVDYIDNDEKRRINKVTRVNGSWLSVKDCLGRRRRVHKDKIFGRMRPKLGLEEINWGRF
jgi:hypothetical protein